MHLDTTLDGGKENKTRERFGLGKGKSKVDEGGRGERGKEIPPPTFPLAKFSLGPVPWWTGRSRGRYGLGLRENRPGASIHAII